MHRSLTGAALRSASIAVLIALVSFVASPQQTHSGELQTPVGDSALTTDTQSYADEYGVDLSDAARRLDLQGLVAEIGARIEQDEADTYGGHWIEHTPAFGVVLTLTSADRQLVSRYFAGTGLESIVEMRVVQYTMRQLTQDLERLNRARDLNWSFDAEVNVFNNGIDVYVVNEDAFLRGTEQRGVELPPNTRVLIVGGLPQPATAMYGGRPLSTCTSGFSVHSTGLGIDGLTAAAHCSDNQTYTLTGEALTFVAANATSGHDEQWHKRSGATFPNKAWDGNPNWRWITGKRGRLDQSVGDYVCHWGKATGYGCGNIISRDTTVCGGSGGVTGIRVHNSSNQDLASGGDSGGPWYISETALGVMSCQAWVGSYGYIDAIYVAENYVETGLNVTIKTSP